MPALSPTMSKTGGKIVKWHKKERDRVEVGDVIAEIETDKAIMEFESVDEGILARILVSEGTSGVSVNQLIALMLEEGEDKNALDNYIAVSATNIEAKEKVESNLEEKCKSQTLFGHWKKREGYALLVNRQKRKSQKFSISSKAQLAVS